MTATYMAAADRETWRARHWTDRIDPAALLVAATSCVAVLAIDDERHTTCFCDTGGNAPD